MSLNIWYSIIVVADLAMGAQSCPAEGTNVSKHPPSVISFMFCFSCRELPHLLCTSWDTPHLVTEYDECYKIPTNLTQSRQLRWAVRMPEILACFRLRLWCSCISSTCLSVQWVLLFPSFHRYWSLMIILHSKLHLRIFLQRTQPVKPL